MDLVTVTYIQYISTIDETVSMATGCSQEQQPISVRQVFRVVLAECHEVFPAGTAGLHLTGGTHRRVRGRTSLGNRQALLYRYPHLLVYFLGSPVVRAQVTLQSPVVYFRSICPAIASNRFFKH